jgi:cytochrome c oxidase subunit 2
MVINTPEDYTAWLKEQQEIASSDPEAIVASGSVLQPISKSVSQMSEQEYLGGKVAQSGVDMHMMHMSH